MYLLYNIYRQIDLPNMYVYIYFKSFFIKVADPKPDA